MTPEISVIIPTFNRRSMVLDAIKSVMVQSPKNYEILVIDDGSTDGTYEQLSSSNLPIRIYKQENLGVSAARNLGIANSRGEFIAFLDSDDVWLPTKLQKQLEYLKIHSDIPLVYTDEYVELDGQRQENTRFEEDSPEVRYILPYVFLGTAIHISSVLVRKSVLGSVGGFAEDMEVLEDIDLFNRISEMTDLGYISEPLVVFRGRSSSDRLSDTGDSTAMRNSRLYLDRYVKRRAGKRFSLKERYALEDVNKFLDLIEKKIKDEGHAA